METAIHHQVNLPETEPQNREASTHYFDRPSLILRVQATFIDLFLIPLLAFIITKSLLPSLGDAESALSVTIMILLLYEPVLTSLGQTFGQFIMDIRVRDFEKLQQKGVLENIGIVQSLARYYMKLP